MMTDWTKFVDTRQQDGVLHVTSELQLSRPLSMLHTAEKRIAYWIKRSGVEKIEWMARLIATRKIPGLPAIITRVQVILRPV